MSWRSMSLEPESKGTSTSSYAAGSIPQLRSDQELAAEIPRLRRAVVDMWFTRDPHQRRTFADSSFEELFSLVYPDQKQRESAEEKLRIGIQDLLANLFDAPEPPGAKDDSPDDPDDEFLKM